MQGTGLIENVKYLQVAEKRNPVVTPAEAGVQKSPKILDSRFRGTDSKDGEKVLFINLLMINDKGSCAFVLEEQHVKTDD